jgi:phenylacetate-CoA ligase
MEMTEKILSSNETLSQEDIEQLQIEKLQSTLNRVYRNVSFYKTSFDENNINIEDIQSIEDLQKLPFTTKQDLRKSYPYDMFAVPLRDIIRIHSSRGRTGRPIAVGYTENDIKNWSKLVARLYAYTGATEDDVVQIAFDYSMFTGAFGFHYGAEKLGASVIPSSASSNIQDQIYIMKDYKSTVLLSTPSYAVNMAKNLKEMDIHPEELSLKIGLFGAEPWGEKIRETIESELHLKAFNNYGVNELVGPGAACECEAQDGLHVSEDHFIVEIIDPETLKPAADGQEGELVFTTITREGFPLIRYRTGDLSAFISGSCSCGRTFKRIKRIAARTDDMFVIRGINIFPSQIERILSKVEGVGSGYQIIIETLDGVDSLEIRLGVSQDIFNDEMKKMVMLRDEVRRGISGEIGVDAKISMVEPGSFEKDSSGNAIRVVDKR